MAKHRTAGFARLVGAPEHWIRKYSDAKLIPCERDSSGTRIFDDAHLDLARRLYTERIARRGRPQRSSQAVARSVISLLTHLEKYNRLIDLLADQVLMELERGHSDSPSRQTTRSAHR